jgi:EAL domain-containing protein (putative c-di-GMP-specific phosphodiesterase class I)
MPSPRPEISRPELCRQIGQEADRSARNGTAFAVLQLQFGEGADASSVRPLEGILRSYDLVARVGRGAYVAILSDIRGGDHALSMLVDRVQAVVPGARIGVATGPGTPPALVSGAAAACAACPGDGTPTYHDPEIDAEMRRRRTFHADLAAAVEDDRIEVVYQPLFAPGSAVPDGVEALARWTHGGRAVPPPEFIGHAERTGLIHRLGEKVLERACADGLRWDGLTVAVNVSPAQLRNPGFPDLVEAVLGRTGFPAERLEVEVTETVLAKDPEAVAERLSRLRGLGVRVALDDFGTGFSGLGYLRTLPFDRIKIDRSFVNDPGPSA